MRTVRRGCAVIGEPLRGAGEAGVGDDEVVGPIALVEHDLGAGGGVDGVLGAELDRQVALAGFGREADAVAARALVDVHIG